MRVLLCSAASIALMTASFDAEARGRGRGGMASVSRHATVGVFIAPPLRGASDSGRAEAWTAAYNPSPLLTGPAEARLSQGAPGAAEAALPRRGAPGREAVASVPAALKDAPQPEWCPAGRVAGSGKGFCLVN